MECAVQQLISRKAPICSRIHTDWWQNCIDWKTKPIYVIRSIYLYSCCAIELTIYWSQRQKTREKTFANDKQPSFLIPLELSVTNINEMQTKDIYVVKTHEKLLSNTDTWIDIIFGIGIYDQRRSSKCVYSNGAVNLVSGQKRFCIESIDPHFPHIISNLINKSL